MQTSLRGIARKAKQDDKYRFGNLYTIIDKEALYIAWKDIKKNSASGIDKETAEEFRKNLDEILENMLTELKSKKYRARLIKRVNIPKGDGKTRPLGLPVLRDKIIQRAVANILEAIYEQDFLYLHYSLDIWFEKRVKPSCKGEAYLCRVADDFICAFRYKEDAERLYRNLGNRLAKFSLELAKEKT